MKILNLGCGTKTANHSEVINLDFSLKLRIRKNVLLRFMARYLLSSERLLSVQSLPENILVYDLRKGIPFEDNSVDVVFNSHLIEHIDRNAVPDFITEIYRVLKKDGILRIVFPDMETLCARYIEHIHLCANESAIPLHEKYIDDIIGQIARTESHTTSLQPRIIRKLENVFLGDARKRGESHRWMYDRVTISNILHKIGFSRVYVSKFNSSRIPNWEDYRLEVNSDGSEYKPMSQYVEAIK